MVVHGEADQVPPRLEVLQFNTDGVEQCFPGHFAVEEERHRRIQHLVNGVFCYHGAGNGDARVRAGVH